ATGGWRGDWGSLCREVEIKRAAGVNVTLDVAEGRELLAHAAQAGDDGDALAAVLARFDAASIDQQIELLLAPSTRGAMAASGQRPLPPQREPRPPPEGERPPAGLARAGQSFPLPAH